MADTRAYADIARYSLVATVGCPRLESAQIRMVTFACGALVPQSTKSSMQVQQTWGAGPTSSTLDFRKTAPQLPRNLAEATTVLCEEFRQATRSWYLGNRQNILLAALQRQHPSRWLQFSPCGVVRR